MTTDEDMQGGKELIERVWPAQEPPAGFAARVIAALDAPSEVPAGRPPEPARRRRWPMAMALAAGVGAAALIVVLLSTRSLVPLWPTAGHHVAQGRDTVKIADRAIAVAAPGAELAWAHHEGGAIRVDQREGAVFYRVDKGGKFVVATAAAEVHVTGTCFEVSISDGAGESGAVKVAVFEGSVRLRNDKGELALVAGDQAQVAVGSRPRRLVLQGRTAPAPPEPMTGARERTAALEARVKQLENALRIAAIDGRDGERTSPAGEPSRGKYFGFTGDEHRSLAKKCELRYAFPDHLTRLERSDLDQLDVREHERAAVIRVMEEHRNEYLEELRSLYDEIVGDPAARSTLSPMGLENEIWAKASRDEQQEAKRRIMQEWAGLVAPPAPGAARPSFERFMRLIVKLGDDFVARLNPVVGPDRAREIGRKSLKIMARLPVCTDGREPAPSWR